MTDQKSPDGQDGGADEKARLALPDPEADARARARARYEARRSLTMAKAEQIAAILRGDVVQTVESAATSVGVLPGTVREALRRYDAGECTSELDEDIAHIVADAKAYQMAELRRMGFMAAGGTNGPGVTWLRWQLEVRDPKNNPRKTEQAVELTGKDGGPVQQEATVRYVIVVPEDEQEP